MHYTEINDAVGNIDIYLLDQVLKGRFEGKKTILDAGCGEGRNMGYFINNGYDVYGIDNNPLAIKMLHMMHKTIPKDRFLKGQLEELPWKDNFFDAVISCAVLHFAGNRQVFFNAIEELIRVLKPQGLLFIRMASNIGLPKADENDFNYLLTPEDIEELQSRFLLKKKESLKSVLVENQRSMAALVFEKN